MDKFKYLFFLLGLMLLNLPLQAKKVNIEKAEKIAKAHVQFKQPSNVRKKLKLSHTAYHKSQIGQPALRSSNEPEDALYYIFNVPDEQGFIIVSGDDVAVPILGYSDEGNYDKSVSNPNFKYWIECLEQEIEYAVENNIPQSVENQALWQNYLNGNDNVPLRAANAVSPLIQTQWNQGSPYSDLCPSGYYTGCVATAMAQIMKYHRTPTTRTVTIPAYTTTTNQTVIPEITGSTTYDWSSMTNTYNASSSATTKTAVATLMYHYGAASKMDYTSTGSGAFTKDAGTALVTFFGYDKGIQYKQRNYYSNDAWHSLLLDELNAGRPIFYGGENSSDGHAFVCDGYDGNGKFHFNWGWSGMYDGYFVTTALNPGTGGAGAGSGTYNQKQEILINIKANEGGEFNYEIKIKANTNITSDKTSVARGETFSVSAPVFNRGLFNFTGNTGIALADANDQIIAILAQYSTSDLPPNYGWNTLNYTCSVPATVIDGNYRLRAAFKPSGSSQWTISTGSDGYVDVLDLTVSTPPKTWNPQSGSTTWSNSSNWINGVPGVADRVIIPKSASYPVLTADVQINEIFLKAGAEIGRQDFLTYNKAHIQLDFSSGGLARDQWHLLSMPIDKVYTGDFNFGGYPYSFLRKFIIVNGEIKWEPFRTNTVPLAIGEGFALWINGEDGVSKGKQSAGESDDLFIGAGYRQYGLNRVNGIIDLPYFEDNTFSNAHRIHKYENGNSIFYPFSTGDNNLSLKNNPASATRGNNAYRISSSNRIEHPLKFGKEQGRYFALVGNPFIATIDFYKLYVDNATKIKPICRIWTGTTFVDQAVTGAGMTYIAPMQAFFVEKADSYQEGDSLILNITIEK